MDLIRAIAQLEALPELHEGRLLILMGAFAGADGAGRIEGITKLAKLDFLLRYPVLLERALLAKGRSISAVRVQEHERASVESQMVRYRFGPWDHRYRKVLNSLVAKGLTSVGIEGRTVSIGLTEAGLRASAELSSSEAFEDVARRARALRSHFDLNATNLMRFIYATFPELLTLRKNAPIPT